MFLEIQTGVKIKFNQIFSVLKSCRCRKEPLLEFDDGCFEEEGERDMSRQFFQTQKNQLFELQYHLERYCNVLPVFGFNCAKYDINSILSYLLPC